MLTFLLWCLLFVVCWPLALLALILYPVVWLILLPFPDRGNRGRWSFRIAARDYVPAREGTPRPPDGIG
jgi:hypothetical protein